MNVITPEHSCRALISAATLQAVEDYRKEVFSAIEGHYPDYIVGNNAVIDQCERFFNDVGFSTYKVIKPGMIKLKRLVEENKKYVGERKTRKFQCPICHGTITLKMGDRIVSRCEMTKVISERKKMVSCDGCHFKSYID